MDIAKFNVWLFLFIFSGLLNIALIGGFCNLMAVATNQGKMPVYKPTMTTSETGSERHFYFNNSADVKYYYLSDIFKIRTTHISIGDFLLFFSCLLTIGMDLILLRYYIIYRREKNDKTAM